MKQGTSSLSASPSSTVAGSQSGDRTSSAQSFWQKYFDFYDTLNQSIPYRRMILRHVELLQPGNADLVLDAGTGTGNVAVELIARGADTVGVDFCASALDKCRQKAPRGDFRFADLTKTLPFDANRFDKIACCCVLHVLDRAGQQTAVGELCRVLKPRGQIAITVFAAGFNPMKVYRETLRQHWRAYGFLNMLLFGLRYSINTVRIMYYVRQIKRREKRGEHNFYSRDQLLGDLQQAGLEVLEVESEFAGQCLTALARKPATMD